MNRTGTVRERVVKRWKWGGVLNEPISWALEVGHMGI